MTVKYECNKCHKLSDKEMSEVTFRLPNGNTPQGYDERIDLCPVCYKKFKVWLFGNAV